MKCYYAHPLSLYGSKQQARDTLTIIGLGFTVENPNGLIHQVGCERHGMDYFKGVVQGCDALAFRGLPCGNVPKGVAQEIAWAREKGLPVIELPGRLAVRTLTIDQTREALREGGQR